MFMYTNGFYYDRKVVMPIAMSPHVADVKSYRKGELLVVTTDSDPLIDSYRALCIVDALPAITGKDMSDVRKAEDVVRDYNHLLEYGPDGAFEGRFARLRVRLGFPPQLPKSARTYQGR